MLEKFLFKKIEVWFVLLLVLFMLTGAVLFGWGIQHYHRGGARMGKLGPALDEIASIPKYARQVFLAKILGKSDLEVQGRSFEGKGFTFNYARGKRPDLGYVLINRYDGDLAMAVSELVDLNTQDKVHQWRFDVDPIWDQSTVKTNLSNPKIDHGTARFRNFHAYLFADGSILTHALSPLVKADICSKLKLVRDDAVYHHSVEVDAEGNYWVPKYIEPKSGAPGSAFLHDDAITRIAPDGSVLFEKSVISILVDNGLGYLVYGTKEGNDDPIHLNDIQPVLDDGPFWKKGDVFLSLRNQSMILLYRPGANRIIWHKQGAWRHQHDVDILDDHRIAIFDNESALRPGGSDEVIFDFRSGLYQSPFGSAFANLDIHVPSEGLGEVVNQDEMLVEESGYGRLVQFNQNADVIWQYINRAANGKIYILNWSRLISRALGDQVREKVNKEKCNVH